MVRRRFVDFSHLLSERFVFLEGHSERRPKRDALWAKQREALTHALYHALETVAQLTAGGLVESLPRKIRTPGKEADRRRVGCTFDLYERVELVRELSDGLCIVVHAVFCRVKEQIERQRLGLSPNELKNGRIESRNIHFGNLSALVQR